MKLYTNLKYIIYILLIGFGLKSFFAQDTIAVQTITVQDSSKSAIDLSFVDKFDSMLVDMYIQSSLFTTDTSCLNVLNLPPDSFPKIPDEVFASRLKQLDEQSPFHFIANDASLAMIKLYAYKRRRLTSKMLGLAEIYFPIFEDALIKYDMPLELKYLPIVESALNPKAKSWAGAGGLWQFMPKTGKIYNLSITSYVDERFDPYLATDAACRYLKKLYNIYNDWSMALAAYNAGPGNVNKAIRRSGGKTTYWEIRSFLPRETQGYVPAFIAVNYVMNFHNYHNIYPSEPEFSHYEIDTLHVCQRIEFDVLEEWLGYEQEKLEYLNPMFTKGVIPQPDSVYSLYLPQFLIGDFIMDEDSIYKYSSLDNQYLIASNKPKRIEKVHIVKSGETMSGIAKKYHCTVNELKAWNNRTSDKLRIGQKLIVFQEAPKDATIKSEPLPTTNDGNYVYYTIRKGDTLWDIAQKYNGVSVNDIQQLNSNLDFHHLKTGTKIKIQKK